MAKRLGCGINLTPGQPAPSEATPAAPGEGEDAIITGRDGMRCRPEETPVGSDRRDRPSGEGSREFLPG